jgi:ubiquinone/menaquinone biosynthesis C-methylase UbiE
VINLAMSARELLPYRRRLIAQARGRVLEVGVGSGLNLPLYGPAVDEVVGLDPSSRLIQMARGIGACCKFPVTLLTGSAQAIPLDRGSIDTLVTSWTLCSIPDVEMALHEMHRVLKSDGKLIFVEHGTAPEQGVRKWQDRLTPLWKKIGGGCHLNRPIQTLVESSGFTIAQLDTGYAQGPKPMAFFYEGSATPRRASCGAEIRPL